MTKKKEGPWSGGPNLTIEEEWDHYNGLYQKKVEKVERLKKQIEEYGYYRMQDDDDIVEVLETLMNHYNK